MIAADVRWPHQKSSPLGLSSPARRCRRLFFCSSRKAGGALWWPSLLPPTSPGCSAGDRIERTEGGQREVSGGGEIKS